MVHPAEAHGPTSGPRRRPSRRNSRGLTTLEWLLIVAAVAGLAALAVVLVQNVDVLDQDETAEETTSNSARETAAKVAADRITSDAIDAIAEGSYKTDHKPTADETTDVTSEFKSKCERLAITYSDAGIESEWEPFGSLAGVGEAALRKAASEADKGCKIPD